MAERRPGLFRTASLGAALLLLAISLATVVAVHDWKQRHAAAFAHPYDNAQWLVFQGAYEALKLAHLFDTAADRIDRDELELRHEIFQSRVITLKTSAVGRLLLADPEAAAGIATIVARAQVIDTLMQADASALAPRQALIVAELEGLLAIYNEVAMRVVHITAGLRTDNLEQLRSTQRTVVDLYAIAAGCTFGLFAIVAVQLRRLRQERERAEHASAAKSAFLATMSHELRTPLNGVIGTLELLADDAMPAESRARVMTARRSADQLLAIIGDVLDMAKLEAGQVRLEQVAFSLDQLLDGVTGTFAAVAARKRLTIAVQGSEAARGWFEGDPVRLRQIAANLVSNALKFTEAGGVTVTLDARDEADRTRLTLKVTDTGIGIPAEARHRLGERFEQADTSTTRRYGGTGLGLAIARTLAEAMGGALSIDSRVGHGTTVTVTALLRRSAAPPEQETPARTAIPAGLRVLVAEDNPVNQATVRALLERLGAAVDVADDGVAAVEAAAAAAYDLILMDMQMPRRDGIDATREIRGSGGPSARSRIVALTANAFTEDVERCLAAGMDAHLTKPVRKATLAAELAALAPPAMVPKAA
jgi:signal transduction histidine kinase/ActR/RegA family two-component response regulator